MLVATWNINGLRARLEYVLEWLRARQPDVVGLQELKMADELFPADVFEAEGYHALVHGQKAWNGVAILSREPAELVQRGLEGQEAFGSRLITANVGPLCFTTVYCPNGKSVEHDDYPRKLDWFDALRGQMQDVMASHPKSVLCGDFNICPAAIDSWDEAGHAGAIFHTDAERQRMQALYDLGLSDVYRAQYPDQAAFSWWDYRAGAFQRNMGLRIDFILASKGLTEAGGVGAVQIDRDFRKKIDGRTASDHAPVMAEFAV